MLTGIIVAVIYGHLGCGAIGGALFSPILRRRIRHLNERYFATRVDVMVALVCGFYTLVQVTRIMIDTEREGAFAGVAVSHRFATDKTVTVSHVDTARVTTRHENADWQVIFEVEGATSETSPTFHFTDEEMFHRYDGKQFVRISWNDVYREVYRDRKQVERILVKQEFVEAY